MKPSLKQAWMPLGLALCLWVAPFAFGLEGPDTPPNPNGNGLQIPLGANVKDPDGRPLTITWAQISGPKAKIGDPNSAKTFFIPTEEGEYVFEITVSNGITENKKQLKKIVAFAKNPPVAKPGLNQNFQVGQRVLVSGANSVADGGKIVEYKWKQLEGPELKLKPDDLVAREFYFDPKESGTYVFELTVSDGKQWSQAACVTYRIAPGIDIKEQDPNGHVEVKPPPKVGGPPVNPGDAPVVIVKNGKDIPLGEEIVLDGTGSYDPLKEKVSYFWEQIRNNAPILAPVSDPAKSIMDSPVWRFKPTQPGKYQFRLIVTAGGKRDATSEIVEFVVTDKSQPPIAEIFTPAQGNAVEVGTPVVLDGSRSRAQPKASEKLEYIWGWSGKGNKPKSWVGDNGPRLQFIPEEVGDYGIQLIVSDGKLKSTPADITIHVLPRNHPPTVAVEPVSGKVGQPIKVYATGKDEDKDPLEFEWTVVEPKSLKLPPEILKVNPLVFTPTEKRIYIFSVVAKDKTSQSTPVEIQVGVSGDEGPPPTAIIKGPDVPVFPNYEVLLDGSHSAPEDKRLTFTWKQESGPKIPGKVPAPTEKLWKFTPTELGKYKISLVVSDGTRQSAPHVFEISVEKEVVPPTAAVEKPGVLFVDDQTWLNGTGSKGDGKIAYQWRVIEGKDLIEILDGATEAKLKIRARAVGKAKLELVVNDGRNDSQPAGVELEIKVRKAPPVAIVTGPESADVGEYVVLSGTDSTSQTGKITEFHWTVAETAGQLALRDLDLNKERLRFKVPKDGVYSFQLVVVDQDGMRSKPVNWIVKSGAAAPPAKGAPVAKCEVKPDNTIDAGTEVLLDARASSDPNGKALKFKWREISGPEIKPIEQADATVKLKPQEAGEYVIELKVDNGEALSAPVLVRFKVTDGAKPPVAVIADVTAVEPGDKIVLDGSGSKSPAGKQLEYNWRLVKEPEDAKVALGSRSAGKPKIELVLPKEGEYVFELKVFDGKTWSEPVSATVKTKSGNLPPVATAVVYAAAEAEGPNAPEKATASVTVEEKQEVILDGTASKDADNGPRPLEFKWKQVSGPKPDTNTQDGAKKRISMSRAGPALWQLVVNDGKVDSKPVEVKITVLKTGSLPVANPTVYLMKGKEPEADPPMQRTLETFPGNRETGTNVIVLDASKSTFPKGKAEQYSWKQVLSKDLGQDLALQPDTLAKKLVGIRIYQPGRYRFSLVVSNGEHASTPASVDIIVRDPSGKEVAPAPKDPAPPKPDKEGAVKHANPNETAQVRHDPPADPAVKPVKPVEPGPNEVVKPTPPPKTEPGPTEVITPPKADPTPLKPEPPARPIPPPTPPMDPAPRAEETGQPIPPPKGVTPSTNPRPDPAPREPVAKPEPPRKPLAEPVTRPLPPAPSALDEKFRADDPLFQARRKKVDAWMKQPGQDVEALLVKTLYDPDADLRAFAAYALAKRGMSSVPALLKVLESGTPASKVDAQNALLILNNGKDYGADAEAWKSWWAKQATPDR